MSNWTVIFSRDARKQYEKLKRSGSKKPSVIDVMDFLALDLQHNGPNLPKWPNYSSFGKDHFHCHLRKGRPTYVACWKIIDKQAKQMNLSQ
ncbi:MAG: cytotoxic translational repressor of toxin-antitoxin stability system [Chlamydiae bacterium]|nr:cytotoxic translational repressor of toxin-antitoxin stability system [Chlamydiota bacterium]